MYKVYYLKDEDNEIVYVGQTKRTLEERFKNHYNDYKHRKNYTIHLIYESSDKALIDYLETYYINFYDTVLNGENITYGKGRKGLGRNNTSFKKGNIYGTMGTKKVLCIENNRIYNSLKEASDDLNIKANNISAVCRGVRKTAGKLHFKFI